MSSAREELTNIVRSTESIRQIILDLENEPVRLLCIIGREKTTTGAAIPDHRLGLNNYFAEAALRALVAAGLVTQRPGGIISIYDYEPTEKGLAIYSKLCEEGVCKT